MSFQVRESLTYCGQQRKVWALPLDSYFNEETPCPFVAPGSHCWRGYVATWEIRADALHLVAVEGTREGWTRMGLDELFPGHAGSVEATWFSGEITPDDLIAPDNAFSVEISGFNNRPIPFLWFVLVVHRGKLLLEQSIDLKSGAMQTRISEHAGRLFPDQELAFLQAIHTNAGSADEKAIYADWLEEQGDPRGQLLRAEVERLRGEVRRGRALPARRSGRQDIDTGFVDPENLLWYWRRLADIPDMTPEEREYRRLVGKLS